MTVSFCARALWLLALTGCAAPSFDGTPSIEVGTGEFAFEPVTEGDTLRLVRGLQGGTHLWLGVRAQNLDPRGLELEASMFDEGGEPYGEVLFFEVNLFEGPDGLMQTAGLPLQTELPLVRQHFTISVVAVDRAGQTAADAMFVYPTRI